MPSSKRCSIVIPVYNEKNTILEVIDRVQRTDAAKEVIVIDDCSTDGTRALLQELPPSNGLKIIYQPHNQGKGAALRAGFAAVSGDIVIVQDADLEYDPDDYPILLQPILDNKADVVYGSRFLGGPHRVLLFWHSVGNKVLTMLSNMMTDLNLTDMETCYKVFRADLLKKIQLRENRFGFEPEFTAKVAKAHCRVYEVPVSYSGRDYSEGKKISWKDGVAAIYLIFKYRFFN